MEKCSYIDVGKWAKLLAIMHAKRSTVIKDRKAGKIELLLQDVDYESFKEKGLRDGPKNRFVSFKKCKFPLMFFIETPRSEQNIKDFVFKLLEFHERGVLVRRSVFRV